MPEVDFISGAIAATAYLAGEVNGRVYRHTSAYAQMGELFKELCLHHGMRGRVGEAHLTEPTDML